MQEERNPGELSPLGHSSRTFLKTDEEHNGGLLGSSDEEENHGERQRLLPRTK